MNKNTKRENKNNKSNNKSVENKEDIKTKYDVLPKCENVKVVDYEILLNESICNDSHFRFKSERNWDKDIKSQTKFTKHFTLDLKALNESIITIPFYERHNYDKNIFNSSELETIKKQTQKNSQKYTKYLETYLSKKNNEIIVKKSIDKPKDEIKVVQAEPVVEVTIVNEEKIEKELAIVENNECQDDVNDLLNLKDFEQKTTNDLDIKFIADEVILHEDPLLTEPTINKQIVEQKSVDLEQWLDDILDD